MAYNRKDKHGSTECKAHKYRIYPTDDQKIRFAKTFGCCRYLWNRMLSDHDTLYREIGIVPDNTPADYKDLDECLWLNEVDSLALANVQMNLRSAFSAFFAGRNRHPVFKKKNSPRQSYKTNVVGNNIRLEGESLVLPKVGKVRIFLHRPVPGDGWKLKSAVISHESNGAYYVSLLHERPKVSTNASVNEDRAIGLDMSVPHLYMDSDGNLADYEKPYRRMQERLKKEQRKLSGMKKDSNNYRKQKERLAKLYAKTKHQRMDTLHKLSHRLTEQYDLICIEDLDMTAIIRSLKLAKSASDNGWGMFVGFLAYKQECKGHHLIRIGRFFASSKTCSHCGYIHRELTLSDRIYVCPVCGNVIDRDENAAVNIREEGLRIYETMRSTA